MNLNRNSFIKAGLAGLVSLVLVGCGSKNENDSVETGLTRWHKMNYSSENNSDYVEDFAGLNMKMVWVPGGGVEIFKGPEVRSLVEDVDGFWMSETEVSIKQYLNFIKSSGYSPAKDTHREGGGMSEDIRKSDFPVTDISFLNAKKFVDYLTAMTGKDYNIPTYAEWIFACRGKNVSPHGIYGEASREKDNLRFEEDTIPDILPVRSLQPNERGLYGMLGNVAEFMIIPKDSILFGRDDLRDNQKFKDGSIVISPGADSSIRNLNNFKNCSFFPNPYKSDYAFSDLLYEKSAGFRVIRRPSEND